MMNIGVVLLSFNESGNSNFPLVSSHKHKFSRIKPKPPAKGTSGSVGWDVFSNLVGEIRLYPHTPVLIPTGLCLNIPQGYEVQVRPRSSLGFKGIGVPNAPGTIDSDYHSELGVILINHTSEVITLPEGAKIAQLVPAEVCTLPMVVETIVASDGERTGGFGTTGEA